MFLKSILAEDGIIVIQTDSAMLNGKRCKRNELNEERYGLFRKDKELCFVGRESRKLKVMRSSVSSLFVRVKGESQESSLETIAWQPDGRAVFG